MQFSFTQFFLSSTLCDTSSSAHLYSDSSSPATASTASLQCLRASSFVFSSPPDLATASKAVSTSPAKEKPLVIMSSKKLNSFAAKRTGAVARPSLRSAAAGLPRRAELFRERDSIRINLDCYLDIVSKFVLL